MVKDDTIYIRHMLTYSAQAANYIKHVTRDEFDSDDVLRLALAHLIQVIGEASRLVSKETRAEYPNVPWSSVIGMRHRIVHDYVNIRFDIVWDIAKYELPQLILELEKIILQNSSLK